MFENLPSFAELIRVLSVYAIPVVLAITIHEAAHAYAANYFGDKTAVALGRLSLNPVKHIDPWGTIAIPIILYLVTAGSFLFGYAKPVPIRQSYLRNPKRDMAFVAFAGPLSNFIMAFLWLLFNHISIAMGVTESFILEVAKAGVLINLVLFALNMLPLPPLDGGRIVAAFLPSRLAMSYERIEPYGFFILLGLLFLGVLKYWLYPIINMSYSIISSILSLFGM